MFKKLKKLIKLFSFDNGEDYSDVFTDLWNNEYNERW